VKTQQREEIEKRSEEIKHELENELKASKEINEKRILDLELNTQKLQFEKQTLSKEIER